MKTLKTFYTIRDKITKSQPNCVRTVLSVLDNVEYLVKLLKISSLVISSAFVLHNFFHIIFEIFTLCLL